MIRATITHPHTEQQVEAVTIETVEDLVELRADTDWHGGALALLTYPSGVTGYLSFEAPKFFGAQINVGDTILRGPAGDFERARIDAASGEVTITAAVR